MDIIANYRMRFVDVKRRWVELVASDGSKYQVTEPIMPRIGEPILKCVVYLYETKEAATNGVRSGGTGFLIGVKSDVSPDHPHLYVVTNDHVISGNPNEGTARVVRFNNRDAPKPAVTVITQDWTPHKAGHDIAICPIKPPESADYLYLDTSKYWIVNDGLFLGGLMGIGSDVFMVGRFINHAGVQRNTPCVRFGSVGMMPEEKIKHRGKEVDAFLVEARSVGGYSGSPVFVPLRTKITRTGGKLTILSKAEGWGDEIYLLGIDCGHLPTKLRVKELNGKDHHEGWYVNDNSGMSVVVPAWRLAEMLEYPAIVELRKEADEKLRQELPPDDTIPD